MGFAKRRAAGNRGADAGRNRGIEKIDVERDVQHAFGGVDLLQKLAQGGDDAAFVQGAHVVDGEVASLECGVLGRIDGADAEQANVLRRHGRGKRGQGVEPFAPCEIGDRHAVIVAADGRRGRVKVGMGVEPEHEEGAALGLGVRGNARDGAQRHRMIAAEEDGKACVHRFARHVGQRRRPGHDFGFVMNVRVRARARELGRRLRARCPPNRRRDGRGRPRSRPNRQRDRPRGPSCNPASSARNPPAPRRGCSF